MAVSFHENKRSSSPLRTNGVQQEAVAPPRANKRTVVVVDQPPTAAPSTRLSGLMKRIQAKANDCQTQLESFVSNVSSAVHLGHSHKKIPTVKNCPQGVVIGPVQPTNTATTTTSPHVQQSPTIGRYAYNQAKKVLDQPDKNPSQGTEQTGEKETVKNGQTANSKHTYVIKLATLTPATMHSAHRRSQQQQHPADAGPFKTWNGPASNKTRPDLSLVGFRPDKHVTCIEVTLINNRTSPDSPSISEPARSPPLPLPLAGSGAIKTYCFGELPGCDKSPSGTISSRSSSRGSEQFDSGFEETANANRKPESIETPTSTSIIRSIFDKIGGNGHQHQRTPKVQAKRSTIRREKAFRQRNKHAWSRAKEIQRNDELLQRFHQIRKRLGEEDELEDSGLAMSSHRLSPDDLLCPLPSIVQTLVRQYDTGGQQRSRDKIVPSRLHSKRSTNSTGNLPSKQTKSSSATSFSTQVLAVARSRPLWSVHGHLLCAFFFRIFCICSAAFCFFNL